MNGTLAVLAVLAYRTISYWLATVPGMIAYVGLRRRILARRAGPDARLRPEAPASGGAATPKRLDAAMAVAEGSAH